MTACHWASDIFEWIAPVLGLDEEGVAGDARIVDQDVEAAEMRDHGVEAADHLELGRHVATKAFARTPEGCTLRDRLGERRAVAVEGGDFGALRRKGERHCAPESTGRARDDHDFLAELHGSLYCTANTDAEMLKGSRP